MTRKEKTSLFEKNREVFQVDIIKMQCAQIDLSILKNSHIRCRTKKLI